MLGQSCSKEARKTWQTSKDTDVASFTRTSRTMLSGRSRPPCQPNGLPRLSALHTQSGLSANVHYCTVIIPSGAREIPHSAFRTLQTLLPAKWPPQTQCPPHTVRAQRQCSLLHRHHTKWSKGNSPQRFPDAPDPLASQMASPDSVPSRHSQGSAPMCHGNITTAPSVAPASASTQQASRRATLQPHARTQAHC